MLGFLLSTRILLKTYVSQGRKSFFSYVNSESGKSKVVCLLLLLCLRCCQNYSFSLVTFSNLHKLLETGW